MTGFYIRQVQGLERDPTMMYTDNLEQWLRDLDSGKITIVDHYGKKRKYRVCRNALGNSDIVFIEYATSTISVKNGHNFYRKGSKCTMKRI